MQDKEFPVLKNDLILRAARGEAVERVPVWVMRQAGRYLPEFREFRKTHDFFEIVQTPEFACEITLQPIRRFDLDAAIIFSDILVIPQVMGMEVQMIPGKGPTFTDPLNTPEDISTKLLPQTDVYTSLKYVLDAITLTRKKLEGKCPLIGFTGAPWTLMSYMIEGGGSRTQSKAKRWLYQYADDSHHLLSMITTVVVDFLVAQAEAGAQMLQVFDSHAGILGPQQYAIYGLPYLKIIIDGIKSKLKEKKIGDVPIIIFAKDAHYALSDLKDLGYDVVGLDWTIDPLYARQQTSNSVALQGNMDPCALYADPSEIREIVKEMLKKFGTRKYIANLGHGIYPDAPIGGMGAFVKCVHEVSAEMVMKERGNGVVGKGNGEG